MEEIGRAGPGDREAISALLEASGLPHQDIEPHLSRFRVAREQGKIAGVVGLEVVGRDGLIRSLAVREDRRGRGIARRLYAHILSDARALGIERLYLFTESAQGFFELLGFRAVERGDVPASIRGTEEFRVLCPSSAVCMTRPMPRG